MSTSGRRTPPRSALVTTALVTAVTALSLSACASASDDPESAASSSTPSSPSSAGTTPASSSSADTMQSPTAAAAGVTIPVTFDGDSVTPNGKRYEVPVGEDVTLTVTADQAGEIHVHSTPEQELEYAAGTTTVTITGLDQPGIVEVESHSLDRVIVQLQVQ